MLMLKALRERSIALLWGGQALSAVGDEIYRVALIWLAVGLIGADAGYLAAGQAGALLLLSLIGGHWADEWNHRRTMIGVDGLRALIVLVPVAAYYFGKVTLPVLLIVALPLSALSAFFDPALQATLPDVSPDAEILQAATGLMATTVRLARAVGPALVGALAGLVPTIHFFTLDAASFAASALSVARLRPAGRPAPAAARRARGSFKESLVSGFREVGKDPLMRDLMLAKLTGTSIWNLAFGLGLALLVQLRAPGDMRAFGWTVAAYGVGNLAGALYVGNMRRPRPAAVMFRGYALLGAGFFAMGVAPGMTWLCAACALGGFGGPISDVPFIDIIQARYPVADLPKIFRLKTSLETGAGLLLLCASPALFRAYRPQAVLAACGAAFAAIGAVGFAARAEPAA